MRNTMPKQQNVVCHHFRVVDHQLWQEVLHNVENLLNFATNIFINRWQQLRRVQRITQRSHLNKNSRIMKKMILSIAILLVTAGLAAPSAMARSGRGGAMSTRPSVGMRGPIHGPRVDKPMPPVGGRPMAIHYGTRVTSRPSGVVINFGGMSLIYNDGVFYSSIGRHYEVVRPSIGMIVPSLPIGHSVMMRNGVKHYLHNGIIYSPVHRNGRVVFRIAGFI